MTVLSPAGHTEKGAAVGDKPVVDTEMDTEMGKAGVKALLFRGVVREIPELTGADVVVGRTAGLLGSRETFWIGTGDPETLKDGMLSVELVRVLLLIGVGRAVTVNVDSINSVT